MMRKSVKRFYETIMLQQELMMRKSVKRFYETMTLQQHLTATTWTFSFPCCCCAAKVTENS
ncbi:hypothetical protein B7W85_08665 [Allorhizobium ampelinum]|nr:hypothetical protein B7W85_08665 [Allorhizobium ampelinum]